MPSLFEILKQAELQKGAAPQLPPILPPAGGPRMGVPPSLPGQIPGEVARVAEGYNTPRSVQTAGNLANVRDNYQQDAQKGTLERLWNLMSTGSIDPEAEKNRNVR